MKYKYKYDRGGGGGDSSSNDDDEKKLKSSAADVKYKSELNRKTCLIWTVTSILLIWVVYSWMVGASKPKSADHSLCFGSHITDKVCNKLEEYEITGNLCLELCINRELRLPDCASEESFQSESAQKFRYFHLDETTLIYVENNDASRLEEELTFDEFKDKIHNLIMQRLNDSTKVQKIVNEIIFTTDTNKDRVLNYQEANTLWTLLNNRATFYMLVLGGKSYIPRIRNMCGNLIELEEIKNHLNQPKDYSLFKSVFTSSVYWYKVKPLHRLKIALGIMEFYMQASEFNPNDEFGSDSLLLCSPIDVSFGYTFFNDAKLINYDGLMTTAEALRRLGAYSPGHVKTCRTHADCVLNDECTFKCDTTLKKCTPRLVKPHIVNFCNFLRKFFEDDKNITALLDTSLARCAQLNTFYADERIMYGRSEMPLTYPNIGEFVERRDYWSRAEEYSLLINEMHKLMWDRVKLAPDPKKPKKVAKKKKSETDETNEPSSPP